MQSSVLVCIIALTALGSAALPSPAHAEYRATSQGAPAEASGIAISPETTYLTGPRSPDGSIDYVAALNEAYRKGVTRENNAAIPLWQALGPGPLDASIRQRFFQELGIDPLPASGEYFKEPSSAQRDQIDKAAERPWTAEEFPTVAKWLESNRVPLDRAVEASRRPRFYSPLIPGPRERTSPVMACLLPAEQSLRTVVKGLVARALLRVGAGETEAAWEDLQACHRWARLVGQGPFAIGGLVGIACETVACRGGAILAHHAPLTRDQAERFLADWRSLPPLPAMSDKLAFAERLSFLDAVTFIADGGTSVVERWSRARNPEVPMSPRMPLILRSVVIDWNDVLRRGNQWYDQLAEAARPRTRPEWLRRMDRIDAEIGRMKASANPPNPRRFSSPNDPEATRRMGLIMTVLLTPAVRQVREAEDRGTNWRQLAHLSLALAAYRGEHGEHPDNLSQLVPKFLDVLPKDMYNGNADYRYQLTGPGYRLYSVGPNGQDDGGRRFDSTPPGDDFVLADTTGEPLGKRQAASGSIFSSPIFWIAGGVAVSLIVGGTLLVVLVSQSRSGRKRQRRRATARPYGSYSQPRRRRR